MMATADELFTERASIMVGEKKSGTTNWPSAHRHSRPGGKVTRKQMAAIDENRTVLHTVHCILKKKQTERTVVVELQSVLRLGAKKKERRRAVKLSKRPPPNLGELQSKSVALFDEKERERER